MISNYATRSKGPPPSQPVVAASRPPAATAATATVVVEEELEDLVEERDGRTRNTNDSQSSTNQPEESSEDEESDPENAPIVRRSARNKTPQLTVKERREQSDAKYENAGGLSCHQCKSIRELPELTYCKFQRRTHRTQIVPAGAVHRSQLIPTGAVRNCRKKFCYKCLKKFYDEVVENSDGWKCPSCRDICCCAACRRRYPPEKARRLELSRAGRRKKSVNPPANGQQKPAPKSAKPAGQKQKKKSTKKSSKSKTVSKNQSSPQPQAEPKHAFPPRRIVRRQLSTNNNSSMSSPRTAADHAPPQQQASSSSQPQSYKFPVCPLPVRHQEHKPSQHSLQAAQQNVQHSLQAAQQNVQHSGQQTIHHGPNCCCAHSGGHSHVHANPNNPPDMRFHSLAAARERQTAGLVHFTTSPSVYQPAPGQYLLIPTNLAHPTSRHVNRFHPFLPPPPRPIHPSQRQAIINDVATQAAESSSPPSVRADPQAVDMADRDEGANSDDYMYDGDDYSDDSIDEEDEDGDQEMQVVAPPTPTAAVQPTSSQSSFQHNLNGHRIPFRSPQDLMEQRAQGLLDLSRQN